MDSNFNMNFRYKRELERKDMKEFQEVCRMHNVYITDEVYDSRP